MFRKHKYVSVRETASILSVSGATVRNWIKHDYLRPAGNVSGTVFSSDDVYDLKNMIRSGSIRRLNARANKAHARKSFIPDEYLENTNCRATVASIVSHIAGSNIDTEKAIFILSLTMIIQEGISRHRNADEFIKSGFYLRHNGRMSEEIAGWHAKLGRFSLHDEYSGLSQYALPRQRDILGLIYQSLLLVGDKSRRGSYYTPDAIAIDIARSFPGARKILDPCCGTGQFLMAFAQETGSPLNMFGYDIDELAVRIARINLMLQFKGIDFNPGIYPGNFFLEGGRGPGFKALNVDVIVTNPPWGLHCSKGELADLSAAHPEIKSHESFSYILKKSIDLLPAGGRLSFILPESILFVRAHGDIRKYILETARIEKVAHLGRIFKNVFTPVVRLDLRKGGEMTAPSSIAYRRPRAIKQERFANNKNYVFDIHTGARDDKILRKVHDVRYTTLAEKADWALGIVTGNNEKFLSKERIDDGFELIYKGRDVGRYHFMNAASYIKFTPEKFQQSAPEYKYRAAEKIVYRFISKNLVCAYDDRGRLTLNSANAFIPRVEGFPAKAILALFNSALYQFIFQKKFHSIKVLRAHLEQLPLPLWGAEVIERLSLLAEEVLSGKRSGESVDEYIMDRFGLSKREADHVRGSVL